jgi:hypothetical protein
MIPSTITKQKTASILFAILLFSSPIVHAQKTAKVNQIYKIWVKPMDHSKVIKGYLYKVNETSISLYGFKNLDTANLINIDSKNIDVIKWRKKGRIKKGLGYGAAGGALVGLVVGITMDLEDVVPGIDSPSPDPLGKGVVRGALTFGTTIAYGVLGSGIGTGIGLIKNKVLIKGDIENYAKELAKLKVICIK